MKAKVFSRKGECPECHVHTGSTHNMHCKYAYAPLPNSHRNQKKLTAEEKLILIANIIQA